MRTATKGKDEGGRMKDEVLVGLARFEFFVDPLFLPKRFSSLILHPSSFIPHP